MTELFKSLLNVDKSDSALSLLRRLSQLSIIGAKVAGCVAAFSLAERGIPVNLFETGRGPGGRLSTRRCSALLCSTLLCSALL